MSTHTSRPTAPITPRGKFGVYFRTSNWFGAPHHPTVITVEKGTVTAVTGEGHRILWAPARELVARFTVWGTLILDHNGRRTRFVTGSYAGRRARPFTDQQKRELAGVGLGEPDDATDFNSANINSPMDVAMMFSEQHRAFLHTLHVTELIEANGATATYTTKSYTAAVWSAAAVTLPALAVLVAASIGLTLLIGEWLG